MNAISETKRFHRRLRLLACLMAGGFAMHVAAVSSAGPPTVNGKLDRIGPYRVLRVWGSPAEMGFAHGYLIGAEVLDYIEEGTANLTAEQRSLRSAAVVTLAGLVDLPPDVRTEIDGIFDGIVARLGEAPRIDAYGRPLKVEDLIVFNAADLLRAFGCSGFTVWGESAGRFGLVTTRNFDFPAPGPKSVGHQLVLVRDGVHRHKVATITWPAYIGAFTGINEYGVCVFMHDGTGRRLRAPGGRYTPLAISLMGMLEGSTSGDALGNTEGLLRQLVPYPFSYMVRVIAPRPATEGQSPVRVFRVDGDGLSENGMESSKCITTNHYLTGKLEAPPDADAWSVTRYGRLQERLQRPITREDAWQALRAVSVSDRGFGTLHSLVVYPRQKRLDLALAEWKDGKVVAAASREPTVIEFIQLFGPWD